jgi:rhodanese-related sulfurtransferase
MGTEAVLEPGIRCDELYSRLGDDEVLVLDVRRDEEWRQYEVHIPGALRMTPEEVAEYSGTLPDDELIVLCSLNGDPSEVRRAFRQLRLRGRIAVYLEGGLRAWVSEGYPIDRHQDSDVESERQRAQL